MGGLASDSTEVRADRQSWKFDLDERNKSATSVLDMFSVVRGTASGVFSSDGSVFVSSKFARCKRVEARQREPASIAHHQIVVAIRDQAGGRQHPNQRMG
jgi:hypothetical protein